MKNKKKRKSANVVGVDMNHNAMPQIRYRDYVAAKYDGLSREEQRVILSLYHQHCLKEGRHG